MTRLDRQDDLYVAHTDRGVYSARNAIVVTGSYPTPYRPPFTECMQPDILQLHSSTFRNPAQLRAGAVLVVGAGNSGVQIALDVAHGRQVWRSGRSTPYMPQRILGKDLFWWLYKTVFNLSTDSPLGRWLIQQMADAGDIVVGGKPELADDHVLDTPNVIWATGFRYDYGWIQLPIFDDQGLPRHERGVVLKSAGLYFIGLPFLHRANSSLVGGVGPDAEYVARRICDTARRGH